MNQVEELVGEWFLPRSNFKISGQLLVNWPTKKIELILYGRYFIEQKEIDFRGDNDHEYFHDLVLGETTFDSITIINCSWQSTKPLGQDFYEIRYLGKILLKGVHILDKADLKIKTALVKFPFLSSWYDGLDSIYKSDYYDKGLVSKRSSEVVDVNGELKFNFVDDYQKVPLKFGISYEVNFEKFLEFQYSNEVNFDTVLSDAIQFSKLLEFSTRKKTEFKIISITVTSGSLSKIDHRGNNKPFKYVPIVYFETYTKDKYIERFDVNQQFMLLSGWNLSKDTLNKVIQKWYSNRTFYHIYDYYLDSNNWFEGSNAVLTNVMFNNRFLNLIQALESYHKKLDLKYQNHPLHFSYSVHFLLNQ